MTNWTARATMPPGLHDGGTWSMTRTTA